MARIKESQSLILRAMRGGARLRPSMRDLNYELVSVIGQVLWRPRRRTIRDMAESGLIELVDGRNAYREKVAAEPKGG